MEIYFGVYPWDLFVGKSSIEDKLIGERPSNLRMLKDFSLAEIEKLDLMETSFVVPSHVADFRIRYFTPGHEMDLCGHATMGTVFALYQDGLINKTKFNIETNAGVLPIQIHEENNQLFITMQHAAPQFKKFEGSRKDLMAAIGLKEEELHTEYPIVYVVRVSGH